MSQGDYLNFKKTSHILKELQTLPSTIDSNQYINFKSFNMLVTVANENELFNRITPVGKTIIFDAEKNVSGCSRFDCTDTDTRTNRKPIDAQQSACFPVMKAPGRSVPTYKKKPGSQASSRCSHIVVSCKCTGGLCACTKVIV
jgi:hypothetical protein